MQRLGWLIRGGREMEDHFECPLDLYRSIPSLEIEGASVLDEFYCSIKTIRTIRCSEPPSSEVRMPGPGWTSRFLQKREREIIELVLALPEQLYDKRINEVLGKDFFASNFWLYWRTMFAFEEWHSALEMKLYVQRFIHHIDGLPGLQHSEVHQVQPVRVACPAADYMASSAGRKGSVRPRR